MQTFDSYGDTDYKQILRPQFHFTSRKNWINDPNGMVWYDGEYHLYFQHNPNSNFWGNMTWGHAISRDMVHWKQLPHAILPYGNGTIFSGSAVVDKNNSLNKQNNNYKTIVAFFTYAKQPFYQAAAFSNDRGRTFKLLNNGDAIIPNQGLDKTERDPKVFWHRESKKWIMALWVQKATNDLKLGKVRFFTSDNMTNWTLVSELERKWVYECIDMIELSVDGNKKNKKWLIYDASFDYEIGTFDGNTFTSDKNSYLGDLGSNFYAAQTFNNSPDSRTVIIGWMNANWGETTFFEKAKMPFNLQMSFPNTLELKTTPEGIRLFRWPIKEIEKLYDKTYYFSDSSISKINSKLTQINAELIDLSIVFKPQGNVNLNLRGLDIKYEFDRQTFVFNSKEIKAPLINKKVSVRVLIDRSSLEIYANNGESAATFYTVPVAENQKISICANENTKIKTFVVNKLKSSWISSN
jgi:sucrose-6-phosphate hydrolase SacC (GH32 family)